jgi:glucose dehydrogenase
MLAAGLIHLVVIGQHWTHAPAHGIFFAIAGLLQIGWSVAFWRKKSQVLQRIGIVMVLSFVCLWALTRVLPAPFGHGPEEVDVPGLASKACEILCTVALLLPMVSVVPSPGMPRSGWRIVLLLVAISLVLTGLTYTVARAAEPLLPSLAAQETHEQTPDQLHNHEDGPVEDHNHPF